ncbi:MAG: MFS transporter [Actinobacteria bacterium]|nr:MFS transporter [Actinomycetota bacterium]MCA1721453.1 MFS transporter [Actinomycetota bacterium]
MALSTAVRRQIAGTAVSAFGNGLTLPFTLILLHEVRGIALPTTGLLLAVPGVVGLAAVPVAGAFIDRVGPRRVLRGALVLQALASVLLGTATSVPAAALALLLVGLGQGPSFPASSALLSGLVEGNDEQARAFGLQFTLLNAAIGSAALLASLVVDVDRPVTFVVLYLGSAVTSLLGCALVPRAAARRAAVAGELDPSYREVLRDPVFRRVCVLSLLLALTGYATLDGGLAAFARVVGHVSPSVIALVFAVNTVVIVAGQLVMLKVLRGRRRSTALALTGVVWGLSWLTLGSLGLLPSGGARIAVALLFGAVFGLGETLFAPTLAPLVNALATDRLRGRYNAAQGAAFSVAFVVAPAVSGALIGFGLSALWIALLVLGCAGTVLQARSLRRWLTDDQDGIGERDLVDDPTERMLV